MQCGGGALSYDYRQRGCRWQVGRYRWFANEILRNFKFAHLWCANRRSPVMNVVNPVAARRYAVVVYLSICLSITGQHCIKTENAGSCKQRRTIAQGLWFSGAKNLGEIATRSPGLLISISILSTILLKYRYRYRRYFRIKVSIAVSTILFGLFLSTLHRYFSADMQNNAHNFLSFRAFVRVQRSVEILDERTGMRMYHISSNRSPRLLLEQ